MRPHWKHLLLGQRKSIANMLAQGWRLKKIASAFMQGYHPLEKFVFLLGRFWPCFRNICIRICSSIRFLAAYNLLFSSSLSTGWNVSMSQPFEFVFVYSFFILSSHHHLNLDSIEDVFSKARFLIAASSKRRSHNGR